MPACTGMSGEIGKPYALLKQVHDHFQMAALLSCGHFLMGPTIMDKNE
jgi:hypothetical protein